MPLWHFVNWYEIKATKKLRNRLFPYAVVLLTLVIVLGYGRMWIQASSVPQLRLGSSTQGVQGYAKLADGIFFVCWARGQQMQMLQRSMVFRWQELSILENQVLLIFFYVPSSSWWPFVWFSPVCPCFSCTGGPRTGHSALAEALPVLTRGEGSHPSTTLLLRYY